jgi:sialic acid synthase SpsE
LKTALKPSRIPSPPSLVLEIGGNPLGDPKLFVRMLKAAAHTGAKTVKLQAYKVQDFLHP